MTEMTTGTGFKPIKYEGGRGFKGVFNGNENRIENSINMEDIKSENNYAGGIIGSKGGNTSCLNIKNSLNLGKVEASKKENILEVVWSGTSTDIKTEFENTLEELGLEYKVMKPHTPKQNGRVERSYKEI